MNKTRTAGGTGEHTFRIVKAAAEPAPEWSVEWTIGGTLSTLIPRRFSSAADAQRLVDRLIEDISAKEAVITTGLVMALGRRIARQASGHEGASKGAVIHAAQLGEATALFMREKLGSTKSQTPINVCRLPTPSIVDAL